MALEPQETVEAKKALRASAVAVRDAISSAQRQRHAEQLATCAETLSVLAGPTGQFSTYLPIGSELDPEPLRCALSDRGHATGLPVMIKLGQPLAFRQWQSGDALVKRKWGILEPIDTAPNLTPDVLLLPLLAFDSAGRRLGYGGGFYDRTLAKLRSRRPVLAIGLAFDQQEVDAVPRSAYDERLDMILTPTGLRSFEPVED